VFIMIDSGAYYVGVWIAMSGDCIVSVVTPTDYILGGHGAVVVENARNL
jgi:hypothetical protein